MSNLQCNETLRDSPSPPTRFDDQKIFTQISSGAQNNNAFSQKTANSGGPNVKKPSPNGGGLNGGSSNTFFVRKLDHHQQHQGQPRSNKRAPDRPINSLERSVSSNSDSIRSSTAQKCLKTVKTESSLDNFSKSFHSPTIVTPFLPSNIAFLTPVSKFLPNSIYSAMFPYNALDQQHYQTFLKTAASSVKTSASDQTTLLNANFIRDPVSVSPSVTKPSNVAKVISLPTVVTRPSHQNSSNKSTILAVNDVQTAAKPLTLHISTGKGTAVLQVQHSASSPSKTVPPSKRISLNEPQQPHLGLGGGNVNNSGQQPCTTMVSQSPSKIFPTAITLPTPAPAAAFVYQDHLNVFQTSTFSATSAFQQNPAKLNSSSPISFNHQTALFNPGTRTIFPAAACEPTQLGHSRLPSNLMKPLSSPASVSLPFSPSSGGAQLQNQNGGAAGAILAPNSTTTPGQSPRPGILRKRPSDMLSATSSAASKRLTYELTNSPSARRVPMDVPSVAIDEVVISTTRSLEHPDAGNSNHSSSASTVSASSINDAQGPADNGGPICPSSSPSPRKRQRKQRLDDLPDNKCRPFPVSLPSSSSSGCPSSSAYTIAGSLEPLSDDESTGRSGAPGVPRVQQTVVDFPPSCSTSNSPASSVTLPKDSLNKQAGVEAGGGFRQLKQFKQSPYCLNVKSSENDKAPKRQDRLKSSTQNPPAVRRRSLWPGLGNESGWKPRRNHFLHYDDVRSKDERKPTITEFCNQKQIWQRVEGWRVDLLVAHFDQLDACEAANLEDVETAFNLLEGPIALRGLTDEEVESVKETALTSRQRVKAVREMLQEEVRKPLLTISKHRPHVETLIQKYSTKRTTRKKLKGDF